MASITKVWNINRDGFPNITSKKFTKVSVGFEWEIENPWNRGDCDCDCDEYCDGCNPHYECEDPNISHTTEKFADSHGFRTHYECGGTEFASPVFRNLGTARAMASRIKATARADDLLYPTETNGCGIHVHTGFSGWVSNYSDSKFTRDYQAVTSMLNRASSGAFILEFSGRDTSHDYYKQAKSTGWDGGFVSGAPTEGQLDWMREVEMVRPNYFDGTPTVEYRIWSGTEDRLQPAIDFAHACTSFITKRKGDDIPYLKEFKAWVEKQAGYKVLKQDPAWSLV
jgi:hypothetical protein